MFRNLDELSAALGAVVSEATTKASQTARVQQVVQAAATGGQAAVAKAVEGLSRAELQQLERDLKR